MIDVPMSAAELASAIEKMTGFDPPTYAAERIGALSAVGDEAAVWRLKEIVGTADVEGLKAKRPSKRRPT